MNYPDKILAVIEHIKSDDAYSLEKEYQKFAWKEEFFNYYSEFILLTEKHNSIQCLNFLTRNNFLNTVNIDQEIQDAVNGAIAQNQKKWLKTFFNNFKEEGEKFPQYKDVYQENKSTIWANLNNKSVGMCSDEVFQFLWDTAIKHANKLYPHLLIEPIIESNNLKRIDLILDLCEKDKVKPPIDSIITKGLEYEQFDLLEKTFTKYNYEMDDEDTKSALITIGLTGSSKSLEYLLEKQNIILSRNYEYGGILVESAIRAGRFDFLKELVKKTYTFYSPYEDVKIKKDCWFYSDNPKENSYYVNLRSTIWEDMEYADNNKNIKTISKVLELIKMYEPEHIEQFFKELEESAYPKLASVAKAIDLKEKITSELKDTGLVKPKMKI